MGKDLKREVSAGGSGEGRRLWAVPAQSLDGHARRTEQDWAQDLVRDPRRQLRGLDPAGQVRERLCGQHVAVRNVFLAPFCNILNRVFAKTGSVGTDIGQR